MQQREFNKHFFCVVINMYVIKGTAEASKGRENQRVSGTCEEVHDGIIRPSTSSSSSHHMIHDHNQHHQIVDRREFHIPSYPMIPTITSQHESIFNVTSTMPFQVKFPLIIS